MLIYKDFIKQLKEGLILTHDITKYSSVLTDSLEKLNIKYHINIVDKFEFKLSIETNDINLIDIINHKCYVLGYYPSYYWIILKNSMKNSFKNITTLPSNTKEVTIKYESKYEDGLYTNDIICPDKLYHLTYQDNKNSILKKGLYPKSKNRKSVYPERIYLFDDINNYEDLLKTLKFSDKLDNIYKKYLLIEINCKENSLMLHTDPNYRIGYFTYDNINPKNIKILKEDL